MFCLCISLIGYVVYAEDRNNYLNALIVLASTYVIFHYQIGYMDGAADGQESTFQSSFDKGYTLGYSFGLELGINEALHRYRLFIIFKLIES